MASSSNIPQIKSYQQLWTDGVSAYQSKTGLNDLNSLSLITSFFQVVALLCARSSGDILQTLKNNSVQNAAGQALVQLAADDGLTPIPATVSSGYVSITDSTFTKIATQIYAGTSPPNIGTTILYVQNASNFPTSGTQYIYVGRGTPNIEGPIAYTASGTNPMAVGAYWQITLNTGLAKFHNINETVILAQGGVRTIGTGTIVTAPGTGINPDITFTTSQSASILDGEVTVANVPITCQTSGSAGNTPAESITEISGAFTGATVTNPLPIATGQDPETQDQLRARIQQTRASIGFGTATAITNAVIGTTAPDENTTVVDAQIYQTVNETTLYVDDGTGYEEKTQGVGIEQLVNNAIGGEQNLQLDTGGTQTSVAKASLVCTLFAPYGLSGGEQLAITINQVTTTHQFVSTDFASAGAATAYEVTASINGDTNLNFVAVTQNGGTGVILMPKSDTENEIAVEPLTGVTDASVILGVPNGIFYTLNLYKNNKLLSQDGIYATVYSNPQSLWSPSLLSPVTLDIIVDGTTQQSITFLDSDFIAIGAGTISNTTPLSAWVTVINTKVAGITAEVAGNELSLSSNLGTNDRSSIQILSTSTLITLGNMFLGVGENSYGQGSDYALSRNTAQISLDVPLVIGDQLSCGTALTEGHISSSSLSTPLTFASAANLWVLLDDPSALFIQTGLPASGSTITVTKSLSPNLVTYTSTTSTAFNNVEVGDYAIIWSAAVGTSNQLEGRVYSVSGSAFAIEVTAAEGANNSATTYTSGIIFVRTQYTPQKIQIAAGTYSLDQIVTNISADISGFSISNVSNQYLMLESNTKDTTGAIMVVTFDVLGTTLGFTAGTLSQSIESLVAHEETGTTDAYFPSFFHSTIGTDITGTPASASYISSITSSLTIPTTFSSNKQFVTTNPYTPVGGTSVYDAQPQHVNAIVNSLSGTTISLPSTTTFYTSPYLERLRATIDRFYLTENLCFSQNDTLLSVVDQNSTTNSFVTPLYRTLAVTASTASTSFNATDTDGGAVPLTTFFTGFDFTNFKAYMQAKWPMASSIGPTLNNKILYRSVLWGATGQRLSVSYVYPTAASTAIGNTVIVAPSSQIQIILPSGVARTTSINNTTQWNVTVSAYTPGGFPSSNADQVTFTYSGTGTAPLLSSLIIGDYVYLNSSTFGSAAYWTTAMGGSYRLNSVVAPSSTAFTFIAKRGVFTSSSGVTTPTSGTFSFFASNPPAAFAVVTYVNASLSTLISATLISTDSDVITYSSDEDAFWTTTYASGGLTNYTVGSGYSLLDGVNYIASSAVSSSPQFTLKNALSLGSPSGVNGYTFGSSAEPIKLVPVAMEQINRLTNILAVTGFNTVGTTILTERAKQLELATQTFGGSGAIQIAGGTGSNTSASLINSSSTISLTYILSQLNAANMSGFISDQIVLLQNSNLLAKATGLTGTSAIAFTPTTNLITLASGSRPITSRYFGLPRYKQSVAGRTFKIEQQGILTCLSWNGSGTPPNLSNSVNFNSTTGDTITVSAVTAVGDALFTVVSGTTNFAECRIGDIVTITGSFNAANARTFLITGVSNDGTQLEVNNPSVFAQTAVSITSSTFTSTTTVTEGDTISIIGAPFSAANQGNFRVVRANINTVTNTVWYINPNSIEETQTATPPITSPFPFTFGPVSMTVTVSGTMTIALGSAVSSSVNVGDEATITGFTNASNNGTFVIVGIGTNSITVQNAVAIAETHSATVVLKQALIKFFDYDATIAGDTFVVPSVAATDVFYPYSGSYVVQQVISQYVISVLPIITVSLSTSTVLGTDSTGFNVIEKAPYTGYKKIYSLLVNPLNATLGYVSFDTIGQSNKISATGGTIMSVVNKLKFGTNIITGQYSYRYDTGLIGEANRVCYGDSRNPSDYPGVIAAGAEIYIKTPLVRKVTMDLSIRLYSGVSFNIVQNQIRNAVAALIDSNDIGQSIPISSIIAVVTTVPGVLSVVVTSPLYNISSDTIELNAGEKAWILSLTDITISQIGT